jgi:hypothetical protein
LVLLGYLKVTWFIIISPIWKRTYLWSDKEGSSDTCQLLTRVLILCVPSVMLVTYFLLQTTKVCSLPWLRIFRSELTRYSMSLSPLGVVPLLPIIYGMHWYHTWWWVAFTCYSSSQWQPSFHWLIFVIRGIGWGSNELTVFSICHPSLPSLRPWNRTPTKVGP